MLRLAVGGRGDHLLEQVGDGDGFAAVRAGAAGAEAGGEGAAVFAALLAVEALAAFGAFVDGELAAGPGGRDGEPGRRVWWRRRQAVLRQALVQYCCRPVGVKRAWQMGQGIVAVSSRDGVWAGVVMRCRPRAGVCWRGRGGCASGRTRR